MPDDTAQATAAHLGIAWDTNTAAAVIVLGALAFLILIRRGFRGVVVKV